MKIEFLRTSKEKSRGLQGRETLDPDTVLLFEDIGAGNGFHMRNCNFPISIASLDENNQILDIGFMDPTIGVYTTPNDTKRVVEANTDFWHRNGLQRGDYFRYRITTSKPVRTANSEAQTEAQRKFLQKELVGNRGLHDIDMLKDLLRVWSREGKWSKEKYNQEVNAWVDKMNGSKDGYFQVLGAYYAKFVKPWEKPKRKSISFSVNKLKDRYNNGSDSMKKDIMRVAFMVFGVTVISLVLGLGNVRSETELLELTDINNNRIYENLKSSKYVPTEQDIKQATEEWNKEQKAKEIKLLARKKEDIYSDKMSVKNPYDKYIEKRAVKYGLDPDLVSRIVHQESRYNPRARSHKGARGLFQIMPKTWKQLTKEMNVKWSFWKHSYDPTKNVEVGMYYLNKLGDWVDSHSELKGDRTELILAAYNAGPKNVLRYRGIPPFKETRNYIKNILNKRKNRRV